MSEQSWTRARRRSTRGLPLAAIERRLMQLARTLRMRTAGLTAEGVGRPTLRRPRFRRPRLRSLFSIRGLAMLVAIALCLGIGWLWFRSSSLVQIKQVTVTGLSGPKANRIRSALTDTARSMTTLDLSVAKLRAAVSAYPAVHSLAVSTHFPHGVSIAVDEQLPLAQVNVNGRVIVVDAAGELLPHSSVPHGLLPDLTLQSAPSGNRITAANALAVLAVLKAAPYRMLGHIQATDWSQVHGVVVQLRNGPELYFGSTTQLGAKWTSAIAVLADSASRGAQYITVSDPRRPAAGVQTSTSGQAAGTGTTPGG